MKKLIVVAVLMSLVPVAAFAATPQIDCKPGGVIYAATLPGNTGRGALLADIKAAGTRYFAVCKRAPARVEVVITNAK
ncbi:hypothetical protein HF289_08645 [Acidithiobacillus ferrooxidans]|uniref:hypothetical protein n=1 Tax=Acidithiobacillus ferrooxidans TaxID=920 RepID=UPI001C07177E|nr:hypothetical protein [Acidithiobacillus ferrooxidans]MBU2856938.1 hypothetical protein [Acidithiobacillus ferrooxidans]